MRLAQLISTAIQDYNLNEREQVKLEWYFSDKNILTQLQLAEALSRETIELASAVASIVEKLEGLVKDEW